MRNALFIDGRRVPPARGATFPVIDPAHARTIHLASAGTAEDIDTAVRAARAAFDCGPWPKMSGAERAKYLRAFKEEAEAVRLANDSRFGLAASHAVLQRSALGLVSEVRVPCAGNIPST